jgi:hypothetical protein
MGMPPVARIDVGSLSLGGELGAGGQPMTNSGDRVTRGGGRLAGGTRFYLVRPGRRC